MKNKNLIYIFLIIFFVLLPFWDVLIAKKTLVPSSNYAAGVFSWNKAWKFCCQEGNEFQYYLDYGGPSWQLNPLTYKISREFKNGIFPFWNQNSGLGMPLAADFVSIGVFNPLRWISFINPSEYFFNLYFILRLIVGGIGMYWLLRLRKIDKLIATGISILFPLTGYFMFYIGMDHLNSDLLIPYAFLASEYLIKTKKKDILIAILLTGLLFFNGNPEILFLLLGYSFIYFIFRLWEEKKLGIKIGFLYVVIFVIGLLLSAVYFIPALEFLIQSANAHNSSQMSGLRTIPFKGIGTIIFPYLFGIPTKNRFAITYIGAGVTFLFILALYFKPKKTWFYGLLFFLTLFKIYETPLWNQIGALPFFNQIVLAKYLGPFVGFFILFSIAYFLDDWIKTQQKFSKKKIVIPAILFLSLFILTLYISGLYPGLSGLVQILEKVIKYLFILIPLFLIFRFTKNKKSKAIGILLIFILLYLESLYYLSNIKRSDLFNPYNKPPYVQWLQNQEKPFRIFSPVGMLFPNTFAVYDLDDIRFLSAEWIPNYFTYIKTFINPSVIDRFSSFIVGPGNEDKFPNMINNQFFDALNVKYVIEASGEIPLIGKKDFLKNTKGQFVLIYNKDALIYENTHTFPRVFPVKEIIGINSSKEALKHMEQKNYNIRNTALVVNYPRDKEILDTKIRTTDIKTYSNKTTFLIESHKDSFIVISQNYYPGWKAKVNNKDVPIYQTDLTFIGLTVPKGKSYVDVYYDPQIFYIGGLISLLTLVGIVLWYKRRS